MSVSNALITIAAQTGIAFEMRAGETLVIVDSEGEQVADLIAFGAADRREWLSSGRTLDYASTLYLSTGHLLSSNRSRPMFEIGLDTVGRHDFLMTLCSRETFALIYGTREPHPSCFANLVTALEPYDIQADAIPTTFDVFINVDVAAMARFACCPRVPKPVPASNYARQWISSSA